MRSGRVVTAEDFSVAPHLKHLYAHFLENGFIMGIRNFDPSLLPIRTRDALDKIRSGESAWESLVPPPIVEIIKRDHLFGWRKAALLRRPCRRQWLDQTMPLRLGDVAREWREPRGFSRMGVANACERSFEVNA